MKDKIIEIHNDDYMLHEDIRFRYIQFFMYAEGGAMGEAGEIRIITKKGENICCYHANCVFGDFKWSNVLHIFPQFDKTFNHSNDLFDHVDLGMGNHLFVRKALKKEFDAAFEFKTSRVEMYQQWFDVAKAILSGKKEWKYCVVGNIVHSRIDKAGILRYGTAQFTGGTKVYLCGKYWNKDEDEITVIGLNRRNKYEATDVPVSAIENVRCSRVYKPKVLEIMSNFEFWQRWWDNTPDDKRETEAFVKQWNSYIAEYTTKRFHDYSLKDVLVSCFGESSIEKIRLSKRNRHETKANRDSIIPLMWKTADCRALEYCSGTAFLRKTYVHEQYILYDLQRGNDKIAYLLFMTPVDEHAITECTFDIERLKIIVATWQSYYSQVYVLWCGIKYCFHEKGSEQFIIDSGFYDEELLYELKNIHQTDMLVPVLHDCWDFYYRKIISVVQSADKREYECLFDPNVRITKIDNNEKKVLTTGVTAVKDYFEKHFPVVKGYRREQKLVYRDCLLAGEREIELSVNRKNLICEIRLKDKLSDKVNYIIDKTIKPYDSLVKQIPEVENVRLLDAKCMHAFAYQIEYEGNNIRNYYLLSFTTREVPESVEIDGYHFDKKVLQSAKVDESGSLIFSNGYQIKKHLLFYNSYRQVVIELTDCVLFKNDKMSLRSVYREPLTDRSSRFIGWPQEAFGPNKAWLDEKGKRVSDIAIFSEHQTMFGGRVVSVESTLKSGILFSDGSWLFPPIYDDITMEGIAKRDEHQFLLTKDGSETPFDFNVTECLPDIDRFMFNAATERVAHPDMRYCYYFDEDYELEAGNWGFLNSKGEIVIEPQYLFAHGFWHCDNHHCIVAKLFDGKVRWGVIDIDGNEVIPCIYPDLYSSWGNCIVFKTEENERFGPYGVMDFEGNVLLEPKFDYIDEYDEKHHLIVAGAYRDLVGVYSLDSKKMIIPEEYEGISFEDRVISCELAFDKYYYYDFEGNKLCFGDYDMVFETDGVLGVWKDGRYGRIDWNGKVLIPPILENGVDENINLFQKGLTLFQENHRYGLKTLAGETIIPPKYDELKNNGDFVVARLEGYLNWNLSATLFDLNGNKILEGLYREICVKTKEKSITAVTPLGTEIIAIE